VARLMPDRQITRLLNRTGVEAGHGKAWTGFPQSSSATASGRSVARLRSKLLQNSSASAT